MKNNVVISLDTDWANDFILDFCVNHIIKNGARAVFFSTNRSEVLASIDSLDFEIGIHPNFYNSLNNFEKPILELKNIYPEAIGGRSHGLFCSSNILSLYKKHGLKYESNNFLYLHPNLCPTIRFEDFYSIPFFWSDDKFLENNSKDKNNHLDIQGLKVYNFHPIHLFLNSPNYKFYEDNKEHYHDHSVLEQRRYKGYGMLNYFTNILKKINEKELETKLISELI